MRVSSVWKTICLNGLHLLVKLKVFKQQEKGIINQNRWYCYGKIVYKGPSTHVLRVNAGYEIWIASIVSIPHLEEVISFKKYLSWKYSSERQEVDQSKWGIRSCSPHIWYMISLCYYLCAVLYTERTTAHASFKRKVSHDNHAFPRNFFSRFWSSGNWKDIFLKKMKKMVWNGPESHSWRTHTLFCKKRWTWTRSCAVAGVFFC